MRLFVALRPPAVAAADLEARLAPLRARAGDLRWTPPEQWHVTLAFLGEVADQQYAELVVRLARAATRAGELPLSLARAGTFPRRTDRARVLWLGLAGEVAGVGRLAGAARAAARRSGISVEHRRFSAHVTLARARPKAGVDVSAAVSALSAYAGPSWVATELELVRSHTGSSVRHETMNRWPLGKGGDPGDAAPLPRPRGPS